MKTRKVNTEGEELTLWNPKTEGEAILGRYEKTIPAEKGEGMIFDTGDNKVYVPVWAVLKELKQQIEQELESGNRDVFALIVYVGEKESKNGTYKRMSSHLLIPQNDEEVDECFNLSNATAFSEGKKGATSNALVHKGAFKEALGYLGFEDGKQLLN